MDLYVNKMVVIKESWIVFIVIMIILNRNYYNKWVREYVNEICGLILELINEMYSYWLVIVV